jgi:hypothetical protein
MQFATLKAETAFCKSSWRILPPSTIDLRHRQSSHFEPRPSIPESIIPLVLVRRASRGLLLAHCCDLLPVEVPSQTDQRELQAES